jgi:hypothetical protein
MSSIRATCLTLPTILELIILLISGEDYLQASVTTIVIDSYTTEGQLQV